MTAPAKSSNPLQHHEAHIEALRCDKAIMVMHLRRHLRPKSGSGMGANRDDHPHFQKITNAWVNGKFDDYTTEDLYTARGRVLKYTRQLQMDVHWAAIMDDNTAREMVVDAVRAEYKRTADEELKQALSGVTYGGW